MVLYLEKFKKLVLEIIIGVAADSASLSDLYHDLSKMGVVETKESSC